MDTAFFNGNRKKLLKKLEPGSLVAITAFGRMQRDIDNPHPYLQEANFWYLTGIEEPEWTLILDVDNGDEWLIAPQQNSFQINFEGAADHAKIAASTGVKTILTKKEGQEALKKLLAKKKRVYSVLPINRRVYGFQANAALGKLLAQLKGPELVDVRPILAKLRGIKSPEEIAVMQRAIDVTVDGLLEVIKNLKNYKTENEIDAQLYYEFRRRGATHGFEPIVASGKKLWVMHAAQGNDPLQGWVLLDVGARIHGYSADIARTIPLQPPTDRQRQVYEALRRAHDNFLSFLKPGASVKDVFMKHGYPFIGEEMVKLGLIKKPLLNERHVFKYMPHAIGHGLGIDVHDPLGRPEVFAEGMVLTDEVGIYIPEEGFGARIENDILITKDGARNMSERLPIDLATIEKMVY